MAEEMKTATFMVMVKGNGDTHFRGIGSKEFRVVPRIGEHLSYDDADGQGRLAKVVDLHHATELAPTAGDIFALELEESITSYLTNLDGSALGG